MQRTLMTTAPFTALGVPCLALDELREVAGTFVRALLTLLALLALLSVCLLASTLASSELDDSAGCSLLTELLSAMLAGRTVSGGVR